MASTYRNIADPKHSIGGLDSFLDLFVGAGTSIQSAEVRHRLIDAAFAHVSVEGREPGQLGELSALILEIIANGEAIHDDDWVPAMLHPLADLAHDFFLKHWVVGTECSRQCCLESGSIALKV